MRTELRHIHAVAKRGTPLGELPDAPFWQKSDIVPAMLRAIPQPGWIPRRSRPNRR